MEEQWAHDEDYYLTIAAERDNLAVERENLAEKLAQVCWLFSEFLQSFMHLEC